MPKQIQILFFLSVLVSCTPKIHKSFNSNSYIKTFKTLVLNDSLKLSFSSPSDIVYSNSKNDIKRELKGSDYNFLTNVLFYGKTSDLEYEFFVTISEKSFKNTKSTLIVYDTLIDDNFISFIGKPANKNWQIPAEQDLESMCRSVKFGTDYNKIHPSVFEVFNKYSNSTNFYETLEELKMFPSLREDENWLKLQLELTVSSMLGENKSYRKLLKIYEKDFQLNHEVIKTIESNSLKNSRAIDKIIDTAKNSSLLMFNENHFFPNHRLLLFDLLPKLKEVGYTKIALEALFPGQDSLLNNSIGFPTVNTGFYTKEQNYGNLIRLGKQLGFDFVEYENQDSTKGREEGQADNLFEKTFKLDSNVKVIVLAGIDHILEESNANEKKWMAKLFKEKYKIDPITINQSRFNQYRSQFSSDYLLIEGSKIDDKDLSYADFYMINNSYKNSTYTRFFNFKNNFEEDVQVNLYIQNELDESSGIYNNVPFFVALLKRGEQIKLPFYQNEKVTVIVLNRYGKKVFQGSRIPF